ncbi:RNA-directed DNA polymerase, eukaryota, reverse transcriptase zinc-binding domain protein [Tanacetum coccineum]
MFGNRCNENNGIGEKVIEEFPSIAEVYSSPIPKVKVTNDTDKNSMGKTEHVTVNKSFIQAIKKNNEYKSELELIRFGGRKRVNVPLEAWSNKGISAIASSIGKPVIMDQTTTEMCNKGVGRIGYARVLVEVSAKNQWKNKVEICYKNAKKETCLTKFVNVLYDWVPPKCEFCKVFGHTHANCSLRPKSEEEKQKIINEKSNQENRKWNSGANQKTYNDKRDTGLGKQAARDHNDKNGNVNMEYRPINKGNNDGNRNNKENKKENKGVTDNENENRENGKSHNKGKWNVDKDLVDSVRRSANKYAIFATVDEAEMGDNLKDGDMSEVNKFLKIRKQPSYEESKNWNLEMKKHFKQQWEQMEKSADDEFEDVLEEVVELAKNMSNDDLVGMNETVERLIIVGWNRDIVNVMVLHCSDQTILCLLESIENQKKFFCCFTYAANHGKDRRSLWKNIIQYKNIVGNHSWVLMGDWNVSLNVVDHSAGGSCKTTHMIEFKECLEDIEVEDLNCSGLHYTWIQSRHDPDNRILKKIHRVLGNNCFMGNFPNAHAMFLPHLSSDHCPAVLFIPKMVRKKKKAFKFANFIAEKPEFLDIVKEGWNMEIEGCYMFKLVDARPHDVVLKKEEARIMKEYSSAVQEEESFLSQQAKIEWLKDGDKNNKFFHVVLRSRKHKSRVAAISNEDGEMLEGEQVPEQFVSHFQKFLRSSFVVKEVGDNIIHEVRVSKDAANDMVQSVSKEEVKEAIFDIDENKAPGPDGFSSKFFKKAWSIVGDEVCLAVQEFFISGKLLGEVNATSISLVPKLETPSKVFDFRPITCCNVIYKCISKILTNRIKKALCKVVSPNQSAFIPGRQITDNILISQELLRGFSINVNGEMHGYFKRGMGLRQGDLISSYLFTLVMEMLNIVVQNRINGNPKFRYHWGCKQLKISHLSFADDPLMFCHGDIESVKVLKGALDEFSMISSLVPNMGKNIVFFRNLKNQTKQEIMDVMPFKVGTLLVTYLGVPLINKQIGIRDCKCLVDKVRAKVNSWKNKMLTYAGRLQLISSVLSSIHVYWASVFMLPKITIKDINKLFKRKGLMSTLIGQEAMKHKSINTMDKVRDLWSKKGWKWPKHINVNSLPQTVPYFQLQQNKNDKAVWKCNNGSGHRYATSKVGKPTFLISKKYHERNKRAFTNEKRSWECLVKEITNTIRLRLASLRVNESPQITRVSDRWQVKMNITEDKEQSFIADMTFSGLVSNILESSGCDCTYLVVLSFLAWPWEEVGLS